MARILAIRLRQMGDVIVTLGALRALKRAYPESHLAFMADGHYHGLLARVDFIDDLIAQPPPATDLAAFTAYVKRLRSSAFDVVLDFHSNPRSALLSCLTGAPRRAGFDVKVRKMLYTEVEPRRVSSNGRPVPRTAHDAALALCARGGFGELTGSIAGTIPVSNAERRAGREALARVGADPSRTTVALNPGKPYPAKAWPDEYFIELAKRLVSGDRQVVVNWGPGEQETAERIAAAAGAGVFVAPALALEALPGFISHMNAVVGIDSGLKHLCVATGVPTVTFFGPTSPAEWHMGGAHDAFLTAGLSCSPCRLSECPFGEPCMRRIGVDDAIGAIARICEAA